MTNLLVLALSTNLYGTPAAPVLPPPGAWEWANGWSNEEGKRELRRALHADYPQGLPEDILRKLAAGGAYQKLAPAETNVARRAPPPPSPPGLFTAPARAASNGFSAPPDFQWDIGTGAKFFHLGSPANATTTTNRSGIRTEK